MPFILRPTLSQTYLERIRSTPDAVGFRTKVRGDSKDKTRKTGWVSLTFREFDRQCRRISFGLMGLGVAPGQRVAILSSTRLEWTLCDMAILGAGAVTVPVYPQSAPQEATEILVQAECTVAICEDREQLQKVLSAQASLPALKKIIVLEAEAMKLAVGRSEVLTLPALQELGRRQEAQQPALFEKHLQEALPSDPLSVCFTSGTTGHPKGAILTQDNLMSVLEDLVRTMQGFTRPEREVLLAFLPLSHMLGKVESMATWAFGWCECYAEGPEHILENLAEIRPTLLIAVPRLLEKAHVRIHEELKTLPSPVRNLFARSLEASLRVQRARSGAQSASLGDQLTHELALKSAHLPARAVFGGRLRTLICGGAPLSRDLTEFFQAIGIRILEGYGLTETCAPVALNLPQAWKLGSVGRPLPEVAIKTAEDGEILVKSRKVFAGYLKNPDATALVLRDGWLHTGDIGHLDFEGFLHVTDRKKDMIVTSEGKAIAPQKIENLLLTQPLIAQALVHGDQRRYLTALLTLDAEQLLRHAQDEGVLFSDIEGLVKNPRVENWVQKSVDEVNARLSSDETIRKFIILPTDFSVQTGELTPAHQVRRKFVNQKYKPELDSMYSP